jgi:hypothetical protein
MKAESDTEIEYPWLVIRDGRTPGNFRIWSRHKTEASANTRCRTLHRNRAEGRCLAIPAGDRKKWGV